MHLSSCDDISESNVSSTMELFSQSMCRQMELTANDSYYFVSIHFCVVHLNTPRSFSRQLVGYYFIYIITTSQMHASGNPNDSHIFSMVDINPNANESRSENTQFCACASLTCIASNSANNKFRLRRCLSSTPRHCYYLL